MRALVTGATGFIGSFVTERLLRDGAAVAILTRPGTDCWRIAGLLPRVHRIEADWRDLAAAEAEIDAFAPDAVLHLAWQGVAGAQRNDPTQLENLMPTVDLARLALRLGWTTFIGLGSQAEYGPVNRRVGENEPPRPTTLYGTVKLCAGLLVRQLAASTPLRVAWVRVFSTYGPTDNPHWLLPSIIARLLRGERPALTACEQMWDYLYVADAAEALCRIAQTPTAEGMFNLGSGQPRPLREIVEQARNLVDPALPLGFGEIPYRPDQVMHLEADIARLTAATGWTPATPLEEGLRQTVAWHRETAEAPPTPE